MHMRESTVHNLNETTFGKAGQIQCCLNRGDECMYFYFVSIRKGSELSQLSCKKRMIHRETIRTNFSTLSPYLTPLFSLPEFPLNVNFSPMSFLNFRASNLILRSEVTIKDRLVHPTIVFYVWGIWSLTIQLRFIGPDPIWHLLFLTPGQKKNRYWLNTFANSQSIPNDTHLWFIWLWEFQDSLLCCPVRESGRRMRAQDLEIEIDFHLRDFLVRIHYCRLYCASLLMLEQLARRAPFASRSKCFSKPKHTYILLT